MDKVQVGFFGRGGEGREGNVNHLNVSYFTLFFLLQDYKQ